MSGPLLTYQDAYEHLLDVFSQNGKDVRAQSRRLRRSLVEAARILPSLHDWEYFRRTGTLTTSPPETLTGSYEAAVKEFTLSSGQWNVDARFGAIVINAVRYAVSRRISDTVIELESGPPGDFTGSVRWQRFRYLLPVDVGDVDEIVDSKLYSRLTRVTTPQAFWEQQVINADVSPFMWSLVASRDVPGRWELWLSGSGTTVRNLSYLYHSRSVNLQVTEINSGTVSVASDVATFSDNVLSGKCVGAVLRIGSDGSVPTSQFGRIEKDLLSGDESEVLCPADYEVVITRVNSDTEAVLASPLPEAENRGYSISSHIDLNYEGMWELFLRLAEEHYDIITRAEPVIRKLSYHARVEAMRLAMASDGPRVSNTSISRYRGNVILDENG